MQYMFDHPLGDMDLTILYTKHSPLSWAPSTVGVYLALRTFMKGLALILIFPIIARVTNHSTPDKDMIWAELGIFSTIAGYTTMALARSTGLMMSGNNLLKYTSKICVIT